MKIYLIIGCILMTLGVYIISLPDIDQQRLFSISNDHGPTFIDFIGIIILLLGYILIISRMWKHRSELKKYVNTKIFYKSLFMCGLGTGLILASVTGDFKEWWLIGSIILGLIQLVAIYIIIVHTSNASVNKNSDIFQE